MLKPIEEQQLASAIRVATYKHKKDINRREGYKSTTAILRALPNAVVVADSSLRVRSLNKKAEELLGTNTLNASNRPLGEIIDLHDLAFDRDGVEVFHEVLSDGRSVMLGEHTLTAADELPVPVRVELCALSDREGVIIGTLVSLIDLRDDPELIATRRIDNDLETAVTGPAIHKKGDLRSYLEVEIVRLSMDDASKEDRHLEFRDGQLSACKRIFRFMFGDDAVDDLEEILPTPG